MVKLVAIRAVCVIAFVYVGLLAALSAFQRQLIFLPQSTPDTTAIVDAAGPGAQIVRISGTSEPAELALYGPALTSGGSRDPLADHRPTLLFFYGNAGSVENSVWLFNKFRRLDANVLIPDYPGYGMNTGSVSETGCYRVAQDAYDYVLASPQRQRSRIFVSGFSLGAAVAIDLAARMIHAHNPVAGLISIAAFTSIAADANHEYPIFPTPILRPLVRYPFENDRKIIGVTCPTLIAHSTGDEVTPYWMSGCLADLCRGRVTRLIVRNAPHGLIFDIGGAEVFPAIRAFLDTNRSRRLN